MGLSMETNIVTQLKKGQGETNARIDRLIAAVERNNQLLEAANFRLDRLAPAPARPLPPPPPSAVPPPATR